MKEGELIRYAQRKIGAAADGLIGTETKGLLDRKVAAIPQINKSWNSRRQLIAYVQFLGIVRGIETGKIDGFLGPQTEYALEQLLYLEKHDQLPPKWRDEDKKKTVNLSHRKPVNPHGFPSYAMIESYYGAAGSAQQTVKVPYPFKLAWDISTEVKRISCHRKVSTSLAGILEDLRDHYGLEQIKALGLDLFGGCYSFRKMRGGKKLSTHAWGVAIDLDPARNRLKWNHRRAQFAKAEYRFLRDAFAAEGWVSLGEAKDYDWMHFQAVRL